VRDAEEDGPEEGDEPAVGAEAQVHRLRVHGRVLGEALVEPEHAQVPRVERVLDGDEALVLDVEGEDQAQHDGEDALVEVIARLLERGAQPVGAIAAAVARRGALEALEEDLDRLEDLRRRPPRRPAPPGPR